MYWFFFFLMNENHCYNHRLFIFDKKDLNNLIIFHLKPFLIFKFGIRVRLRNCFIKLIDLIINTKL